MTDRAKFEAYFAPIAEGMKKCGVGAVGIARRKDNQWQGWQAALASQQPADDGWIEWAGVGEPVECEPRMVDVKFRGGEIDRGLANHWYWGKSGYEDDIIAYRVVKP